MESYGIKNINSQIGDVITLKEDNCDYLLLNLLYKDEKYNVDIEFCSKKEASVFLFNNGSFSSFYYNFNKYFIKKITSSVYDDKIKKFNSSWEIINIEHI